MYTTKSKHSRPSKKFLLPVGLLLAIIVIMFALEITNTTHIFHKKTVPATIPVAKHQNSTAGSTQSTAKSTATATTNGTASSAQSSKVASSTGGSSAPLAQPYGTFVSNHVPGQSGSTTSEQSACNTTSGATCYIQFTNTATNATTKLPVQPVGSDGSTIWSWDANTLTSGEWQVTAVATLNGQSKTTVDPTKLEVQ
jgi:cytoskeletal protein RodZ